MQRSLFNLTWRLPRVAILFPLAMPDSVFAQAANANIYETVLDRYQAVASSWATVITNHATWLFWTLALISMVWTFGMMALRKADIQEFFAEFVRFTIFTGFFWWLLLNGPSFANSIIQSLRQIGGEATGLGSNLTPSTVADIGFDVFFKTLDNASMRSPLVSLVGILLGLGILLLLALVAINMLTLLVSSWVLLYGGVFFLGFGGSRWTSDMAINYYKTVLGVAASLLAMVLIIGVGTSIMDQYYTNMGPAIMLKELAVVLIVAFILAMLVKTVPPLISGIITGASVGHSGSVQFGAGAALGATGLAAAAAATGGAAIAAGAAHAAGGAQALFTAVSKASQNVAAGTDIISSLTGSGGSTHSTPLASAAGFTGNTTSASGTSSFSPSMGSGSKSKTSSDPPSQSEPSGAASNTTSSRGGFLASVGKAVGTVSKIAADATNNLAMGSYDVAKTTAENLKEATLERIAETTGGKIAAAIQRQDGRTSDASTTKADEIGSTPSFGENSLAAGKSSAVDPKSEVAFFRDRDNPATSSRSEQ